MYSSFGMYVRCTHELASLIASEFHLVDLQSIHASLLKPSTSLIFHRSEYMETVNHGGT
jgi:hypothetical protein